MPGAGEVPVASDALLRRLIRIYGSRTNEILELASTDQRFAQPLNKTGDAIAAEIVFSFQNEFATSLSDVLLRRTMLGLDADLGIGVDERAAGVAKEFLSWSDKRASEEVQRYRNELQRFDSL